MGGSKRCSKREGMFIVIQAYLKKQEKSEINNIQHLEPVNITLFGKRVFIDVFKLRVL